MAKLTKLIAVAGLALLAACPPPAPVSRPPGPDGTARWAWTIAQPVIQGEAADAELRGINGMNVFTDGRLPSNIGVWTFMTWSPSQNRAVHVSVNFTGATSILVSDTPPAGGHPPIPATWVDSPQVLAATNGYRDPSATLVNLMSLGYGHNGSIAAWGINFNAGTNQIVRWNGSYVGEG